jgi:phage shock protein A
VGNAKLIVKLVKENEQLKEDAKRYEKLFLEMENKVWGLEDSNKELRREIEKLYAEKYLADDDDTAKAIADTRPLSVSESIIDLDDESIETLIPEQDCGD